MRVFRFSYSVRSGSSMAKPAFCTVVAIECISVLQFVTTEACLSLGCWMERNPGRGCSSRVCCFTAVETFETCEPEHRTQVIIKIRKNTKRILGSINPSNMCQGHLMVPNAPSPEYNYNSLKPSLGYPKADNNPSLRPTRGRYQAKSRAANARPDVGPRLPRACWSEIR